VNAVEGQSPEAAAEGERHCLNKAGARMEDTKSRLSEWGEQAFTVKGNDEVASDIESNTVRNPKQSGPDYQGVVESQNDEVPQKFRESVTRIAERRNDRGASNVRDRDRKSEN
jgi:hypothetical protein